MRRYRRRGAFGRQNAPAGNLTCVCGFGSEAWDTLFGAPRPRQLHPFSPIGSGERVAVATPGDILLHIRADEMDLCFELASQLVGKLGDAVTVIEEVHGFRYFDQRAMIGFVDGTENPEARSLRLYGNRRRRRGVQRRQLCAGAKIPA